MRTLRVLIVLAIVAPANAAEFMVTEATNVGFDLDRNAGDIVFDLYQRLWRIPASGGTAVRIAGVAGAATRPRVSPDGTRILVEGPADGYRQVWCIDVASGETKVISGGPWSNRMAVWHPDSGRVAFTSNRNGSWDIWEIDLAGGELAQRSFGAGTDLYPAYSRDGAELVWTEAGNGNKLILARLPALGKAIYASPNPLMAPGFRPDGTIVTFFESRNSRSELRMVLPKDPAVVKTLIAGPDFSNQAPVWLDRNRALVAADGKIKKMTFGDEELRDIPWTAWVSLQDRSTPSSIAALRNNSDEDGNNGRYVLRIGRVFDGLRANYAYNLDIVIDDDRITAIVPRKDWPGDTALIDYSDHAALPGLIGITGSDQEFTTSGPLMLAAGITSLAIPSADAGDRLTLRSPSPSQLAMTHIVDIRGVGDEQSRADALAQAQADKQTILTDRLYPDIATGAALFAGQHQLPVSPHGFVYQDIAGLLDAADVTLFLAADSASIAPWEMRRLVASQQWKLFLDPRAAESDDSTTGEPWRNRNRLAGLGKRFILDAGGPALPLGLGLHATMGVLASEGLPPYRILQSATLDAALALGVAGDVGSIETNKLADIVIVRGDPLREIDAALDIVAVIRRGTLFSIEGIAMAAGTRPSKNFTYRQKSGIVAR